MKGGLARRRLAALAALLALPLLCAQTRGAEIEVSRSAHWYRFEVIVFAQTPDADDPGIARRKLLDSIVYPRMTAALAAMREEPTIAGAHSLTISNLAPPRWFAGDCVLAHWAPPPNWADRPGAVPHDPCLPLALPPAASAAASEPVEEASTAMAEGDAPFTRDVLVEAVAEHERQLSETSYRWEARTPNLATALRRLRSRYDVLAAGSWHQALTPRDQPQPLLVQAGREAGNGRFAIEGWFSATIGRRYVHFEAMLTRRLEGGIAKLAESRPLRSGDVHYLDHPALGILVRAEPVPVPVPGELLAVCPETVDCEVAPRSTR